MRPWLALALVLIAGAIWLALRGTGSLVVAPAPSAVEVSTHGLASDVPRALDAKLREVLDPGPTAERAVAEGESPTLSDAQDAALWVRALLPDGSPWAGGTLEIASGQPAFDLHESPRRPRPTGMRVAVFDGHTHRLQVETDASGRALFEPIVPGVAFSIRAFDDLDATGAQLQSIELSAGERRELELPCAATAALRGRCVDENGTPLAGVDVHVANGEWTLIAACDETGRFETTPLFARDLTLRARLADRAACELRDVDPAAGAIELVLEQGRSLLVETFDAAGDLVLGSAPTIHLDSDAHPLPAKVTRVRTGWLFSELPGGPLTLRWGTPCRPRSQEVDGEATQARVLDEPLGRLVIEVSPLPHDPDVEHFVSILCAEGTSSAGSASLLVDRVHELEWDLAPGRYRVQRFASSARSPGEPQPLGTPLFVEVRADETTLERMDG